MHSLLSVSPLELLIASLNLCFHILDHSNQNLTENIPKPFSSVLIRDLNSALTHFSFGTQNHLVTDQKFSIPRYNSVLLPNSPPQNVHHILHLDWNSLFQIKLTS